MGPSPRPLIVCPRPQPPSLPVGAVHGTLRLSGGGAWPKVTSGSQWQVSASGSGGLALTPACLSLTRASPSVEPCPGAWDLLSPAQAPGGSGDLSAITPKQKPGPDTRRTIWNWVMCGVSPINGVPPGQSAALLGLGAVGQGRWLPGHKMAQQRAAPSQTESGSCDIVCGDKHEVLIVLSPRLDSRERVLRDQRGVRETRLPAPPAAPGRGREQPRPMGGRRGKPPRGRRIEECAAVKSHVSVESSSNVGKAHHSRSGAPRPSPQCTLRVRGDGVVGQPWVCSHPWSVVRGPWRAPSYKTR